jgi:two-component system response regulator
MRKYNILVADDDDDDFCIIDQAFKELGSEYFLERVDNGCKLLELLQRKQGAKEIFPDLILLDINMPKVDGMQALKTIRETPALTNVPVLMYTTAVCQEQVSSCLAIGANGFINKDCSEENTKAMVNGLSVYLQMISELPGSNFIYNSDFLAKLVRSNNR